MVTTEATGGMYLADVVQFLLPDGREISTTTQLPADTHDAYQAMLAAGCRLEAEILRTNEVSVTIFDTTAEVDVDCRVIENGPEVQEAQVAMLRARLWEEADTDDEELVATE